MTRKDFVAIAQAIHFQHSTINVAEWGLAKRHAAVSIATDLADYFEETYPRFDRSKFMLAAIGYED